VTYHNFYAEISETDYSLSRDQNLHRLKEALRKWRKRQGDTARVAEHLILEAISVFGNASKYEQFRNTWESREAQREPNREDQFRSLVLGAASDGEISQVEYRWLLEEACTMGMDSEAARAFISSVAADTQASIASTSPAPSPAEIARFRQPLAATAAADGALFGFIALPVVVGLGAWKWTLDRKGGLPDFSEARKMVGKIGGIWTAVLYFVLTIGLLVLLWTLCWRVPIAGGLLCGLIAAGTAALFCSESILTFQKWNRSKKTRKALLDWRRHVIPSLAFGAVLLLLLVVLSAVIGIGRTALVVAAVGVAAAVVDHYLEKLRV
jgi:hypothetical protein